jgi:hypothetical protein
MTNLATAGRRDKDGLHAQVGGGIGRGFRSTFAADGGPAMMCYGPAVASHLCNAANVRGKIMKLHRVKECLNAHESDISGSVYDDVNMSGSTVGNVNLAGCSFTNVNMSGATFEDANLSGWKIHDANLAGLKITKANLAGASITLGRMEGMTIDGILVSDLLAAYHASRSAENKSE